MKGVAIALRDSRRQTCPAQHSLTACASKLPDTAKSSRYTSADSVWGGKSVHGEKGEVFLRLCRSGVLLRNARPAAEIISRQGKWRRTSCCSPQQHSSGAATRLVRTAISLTRASQNSCRSVPAAAAPDCTAAQTAPLLPTAQHALPVVPSSTQRFTRRRRWWVRLALCRSRAFDMHPERLTTHPPFTCMHADAAALKPCAAP